MKSLEHLKAFYKSKNGTPQKGTPRKRTPLIGTPKKMAPPKSILSEGQMKKQRKITDLFVRPPEKRKLEKPAPELSPKRACTSYEETFVMAHTPQKFQPSLRSLLEQKTKAEVPEVKKETSPQPDNKPCDVIDLSSDDEDSTRALKYKTAIEEKIDSIISCIKMEEIPDDAVVGSIINNSMMKEEGNFIYR